MTKAVSSDLGANQRLSEYAVRVVARRAERLAFLVEKASRATNEDVIHRLRVAARRLGSALDAFEDHFPSSGLAKVGKQAEHLRSGAGVVRDHDIASSLAAEVGLELSEKAKRRLKCGRDDASEKLRRRLERLRDKSLAAKWAHALHLAGQARAAAVGPTAASYAAAELPRMANEFFEAEHEAVAPAATVESLHAFRILGKRFRYTLEIFAPCYGEELQNALQLMRGVQDILGMINDCGTAAKILTRAAGRGQREQVQSLLHQRQAALVENFRSHWNETFATESECRVWMQMLAKPAFAPASETRSAADQQAAAS
jgi:CHAD domain-containing protein